LVFLKAGNGRRDLSQQFDQLTGTQHIDGSFQVVGVDRQGHFRPRSPQSKDKKSPAMRLGLAKGTVSFEDITYFKRDEKLLSH